MTKAVIFDFDGTLTVKQQNIWERVWVALGFSIDKNSYYRQLLNDFFAGKLTHKEWCNITSKTFKSSHLSLQMINELADTIHLLNGAIEVFKKLKEKGCSLHIVSGNIKTVIEKVLMDNITFFDSINANVLEFDNNGYFTKIVGTNFDFAGKAEFIKQYCKATQISADEVVFVGNGNNDEWAHLSGCKTICINPEKEVDSANTVKWHKVVDGVSDLRQILPLIN